MSAAVADELIATLPFARRYARALAGSRAAGDAMVARALREGSGAGMPARLGLYAGITRLARRDEGDSLLPPAGRELLLLTALEEFVLEDAARIVGLAPDTAAEQLAAARAALRAAAATDVLIIEDEPVIAMELRMLVEGCGHRVVGVAASEAMAVSLAAEKGAGLILADVNLGRGGNGIAAVHRILQSVPVPVIFVTAYPELLLTAEGIEPAFVVRKPFDPVALAIATYQAVRAAPLPASSGD
jgi:CheY-like chemotaxis protein